MYQHTKISRSKESYLVYMRFFGFLPVSHRIVNRTVRFLDRFISSDNMLCTLFKEEAQRYKNIL